MVQKEEKMTLEKLAWIGLGILTSFHIALHAVEIILGWIRAEKQSQIIATESTDTPTDT